MDVKEQVRQIMLPLVKKMYDGLESQQWVQSRSRTGGFCAYRGDAGTKCAVGHLIDDNAYKPTMDVGGLLASDEVIHTAITSVNWSELSDQVRGGVINQLRDFQKAHDLYNATPEYMKGAFQNVIRNHGYEDAING